MSEYKLSMTAAEVNERLEAVPNKADLVGGQVPYSQSNHLTRYTTLYVDASDGDDANPGTQALPFKTIQAAIDSLPKDLGGFGALIMLAPGEYDEDVSIKGFFNRHEYNYLELRGASNPGSGYPANTHRVKSIIVGQNACHVSLVGLWVYGATGGSTAVELSSPSVAMTHCTVKNEGNTTRGIRVGYFGHSLAKLHNVAVDGYTGTSGFGIGVDGGSVAAVSNPKVTNNTVGISSAASIGGGLITLDNPTYRGNTTDTKNGYGGQIFGGN